MTEEEKAYLAALQGARDGWKNLATNAIRAATRWKTERDLLQSRLKEIDEQAH